MDYKPNSHRSKEEARNNQLAERKPIEKAIKGTARVKKKSEVRKFADIFIAEDVSSVKQYALGEVLIPAIKKAISDIVTNGIDMILYGESDHTKKRSSTDHVSYSKYYRDDRSTRDRIGERTRGHSIDDIVLDTRGEAEKILSMMDDILDTYGIVRVADLYDLVGVTGSHTDNKYGWTNLRNAEAIRVRDGYMLRLPRAIPID